MEKGAVFCSAFRQQWNGGRFFRSVFRLQKAKKWNERTVTRSTQKAKKAERKNRPMYCSGENAGAFF